MHGIALHCVATGKDRLMSKGMASIQSVQSGFTCTVHASCRAYHGRTGEYCMGAAAQHTALSGHHAVPLGGTSPPAHRPVVRARRYMPCSSGPVTGCVPVFVDAACIGF